MSESRSCLIIGAGLAGLTAARLLHAKGRQIILLDKGPGIGGRRATRPICAAAILAQLR